MLRRTPPSLIETATITSFALCGDGKASTTDRIYIKLTWSGRNAEKLPEHAILKISLLHPWLRIGGETALRGAAVAARLLRPLKLDWVVYRAANTYNFVLAHAPDAMYDNEARVYRREIPSLVRPERGGSWRGHIGQLCEPEKYTPSMGYRPAPPVPAFSQLLDIFRHGAIEPREPRGLSDASCVLLEDLTKARGITNVRFPNALGGLTLVQTKKLLDTLARDLHGALWCDDGMGRVLSTPTAGGMSFIFNSQFGLGLMRDHLQSHAFARAALAPLGLTADELWEGLMNANTLMATPPLTVCHGDCHVQNSYTYDDDREWPHAADFPETGAVGLYDWQLTCMACWARDVSYIVATALPTATRSHHEDGILRDYLETLQTSIDMHYDELCEEIDNTPFDEDDGPPEYPPRPTPAPSFEEAKQLYAKCMAWGLVVGWLLCPPNNYGEELWTANVSRLVAACRELNTFGLLLGRDLGHGPIPTGRRGRSPARKRR